ncbi:MAG TPA: TetR/AcrR family transcriptional regulator [Streptosporangiaceae bacterium]|nr:TetR/AcrR family transcriptional regulator [Streptosporangiaceae bacterium]
MPKIVDHELRRQELLAATWRVIARTGIVGVTTREIAREAGVSTGVLAHYFADKEELLAAALRLSHQQVYARIRERTQGLLGLDAIRALMLEALPLDEERLLEAQIEINFLSLALGNSGLRDLQHEEFERFWDALHYRVCEAQKLGHIPAGADPSDITHELVILVEGLSQEAVLYPSRTTPQRQCQTLNAILERLASRAAPAQPAVGAQVTAP